MKISNIIISAFAVLVIGSILTLFILAKQHDMNKPSPIGKKVMPKETFQLQSFSAVVAEEGADIHIIQEDKRQIVVEDVEGKTKPELQYEIINDTLFVYGGYRAFVSNSTIKSITGNKAFWMGVSKFEVDTLKLNIEGSQMYFGSGSDTTKIKLFEINASEDANLDFYNTRVKRANIKLSNVRHRFRFACDSLSVNLSNSTLYWDAKLDWLELNKDKKSKIQIYLYRRYL